MSLISEILENGSTNVEENAGARLLGASNGGEEIGQVILEQIGTGKQITITIKYYDEETN